MKLLPPDCYSFTYAVGVKLWLTREELRILRVCAESHYDLVCQQTAFRADSRGRKNGFVTISEFMLGQEASVLVDANFREIDTLAKVLEQSGLALKTQADRDTANELAARFRVCLRAINEETKDLYDGAANHIFPSLA